MREATPVNLHLGLPLFTLLALGCTTSDEPRAPAETSEGTTPDAGSFPVADAAVVDAAQPADASGGPSSNTQCEPLYGERVCWGTLQPSELAPGIRDLDASDGTPGRHFYCYPQDPSRWNDRTLLHIVGTGDNPGATNGLVKRACALGFAGVAPMYENERDARSTCQDDTDCYVAMRREVVYGEDVAASPINVDSANSVTNRARTILDRMVEAESVFAPWTQVRSRYYSRDLSTFSLSGHSQGSGHALLVARDFSVERLVMLGGVTDRVASGTPSNSAPAWIANFAANKPKTPPSRFLSYIHEDDTIASYLQVDSNYDALGLGPACTFRKASPAYPPACRRVRTPAAGCTGFLAHLSVVLQSFGAAGNACAFPGALSSNALTWQFLLTTPLP
jgi:hypothetical protein